MPTALSIKLLSVCVGRPQNLREHLSQSSFECGDPEQLPFASPMLAVACAGPESLLILVFFLSPDTETQCLVPLGSALEGREPQGPSSVAECVFFCPAYVPSKLSSDVRHMCQVWFVLGQFLAEKHSFILQSFLFYLLMFLQVMSCLLAWAFLSLLAVSEASSFVSIWSCVTQGRSEGPGPAAGLGS